MSKQSELLEWAEKHIYYKKGFTGKHYPLVICHNMNMFDERLRWSVEKGIIIECKDMGYLCEWAAPYGFVPDVDCPRHGESESPAGGK